MRRLKRVEKKRVGEFHLIRGVDFGFGVDATEGVLVRFRRYVKKLQRRLYFRHKAEPIARFHLRNQRAKRARVLARNQGAGSAL